MATSSLQTADIFPVVASLSLAGETRNLSWKKRMLSQARLPVNFYYLKIIINSLVEMPVYSYTLEQDLSYLT